MTEEQVRGWFAKYLNTFEGLASGEQEDRDQLIGLYNVPLLLTTDDVVTTLTSNAEVAGIFGSQVDAMREAGFARSVPLAEELQVLNSNSALYTGLFSRRRGDGGEIARLRATYLVVATGDGLRIAAVAVHSQPN